MTLRASSFRPGGIANSHHESLADYRRVPIPGIDSAQPHLRAAFLGHFELSCGDGFVPLGCNTRALAILKYLLAQRTRPVSQDYLMGWLWPESNLKRARWSLNSAIYALRKLLRDQLPPDTSSDFVLLDKGYYRLDPTVEIWTDTDEFEARYEHGRHLERTQRRLEAVAEYEEATGLYRDDYLVEDLYEDWTMVPRDWFANAYMDMLSRLAYYYMETGRYQESIWTCYRLLERDRCHEDGHRLLIECYAHLGLRGGASHKYRLSETALKRNRRTGRQPEVQDLYRRLSER